jgi:hypothetical protein
VISDVEALLQEWAKYLEGGRGVSATAGSLTASIYDFALDGRSRSRAQPKPLTAQGKQTRVTVKASPGVFTNPRAELMDNAVTALRNDCPDLGLVVVAEYRSLVPAVLEDGKVGWRRVRFNPCRGQEGHQERLAEALGIGARTYRTRLQMALHRIDATLVDRRRRSA